MGLRPVGIVPSASEGPRFEVPHVALSRPRTADRRSHLARVPDATPASVVIRAAASQDWIVYAKPPFAGAEQVLEYISRYTHRIAISNRRILSFANNQVTFEWRDYADRNRKKVMTLEAVEFLRRFLMHVLPDRFVRIRYFGFLSNQQRARNVEHARRLIAAPVIVRVRVPRHRSVLCPVCRAAASRREVRDHLLRSPPDADAA